MKFDPHNTKVDDPQELNRRGNGLDETTETFNPIVFAPIEINLSRTSEKFIEEKHLASGGMKDIFQVIDKSSGTQLALAKLHKGSPEALSKPFIDEARLTKALEHPNIIKVHEIGISKEEGPYFTMDLKIGETLAKVLREIGKENKSYTKKYNLHFLLNIFTQACEAIAYAHSKKILHLDLKPENIQIINSSEVLVFDWGLGKVILPEGENSKKKNHNEENIEGTPGYMSPEQVQTGNVNTVSADVYSLGAVLYSVLTLERPINGGTQEILKKTIDGDIIPPIEKNPSIPDKLNSIVLKAMHLNPGERYESVLDIIEEVCEYLNK